MERRLVVVAHPDDAELSCGGSVARWTSAGVEVIYVICTDGSRGTKDRGMTPARLAAIREREQREAAALLGVHTISFLRHEDGELEATKGFRAEIALLIRKFKPRVIVTHDPWRPYMIHPDHRAVGFTTVDAVVAARDHLFLADHTEAGIEPHEPREILFAFPGQPDHIVDISDTLERKLQAIRCHRSQVGEKDFPSWRRKMADWARDVAMDRDFTYGEGFKRLILGAHHYNPDEEE